MLPDNHPLQFLPTRRPRLLGTSPLADLQQPLRNAHTRVAGPSDVARDHESHDLANAEPHQESGAAVSSRPRLTAGNSRHRDEVAGSDEAPDD